MNILKPSFCAALLLTLAGTLAGCANTPVGVATKFCDATQGNPDSANFLPLATPSLAREITEAERKNQIIAEKIPDEKPPLGDGIPFQSYQDFAPLCQAGATTVEKNRTLIAVHHVFTDKKDAPYSWSDRLVLKQSKDGWKIDDILYSPNYTDTLRHALAHTFDDWK